MEFEMLIKEIFNFQDGRTVFVGDISGENKFIKSCNCELIINDQLFSKIHVEGEMLPSGNKSGLRSLSTTDKINISEVPYKRVTVILRCKS